MHNKLILLLDIILFKDNKKLAWEKAYINAFVLEDYVLLYKEKNIFEKDKLFKEIILSALNDDLLYGEKTELSSYCYLVNWENTVNLLIEYLLINQEIYRSYIKINLIKKDEQEYKTVSININKLHEFLTNLNIVPIHKLHLIKNLPSSKRIVIQKLKETKYEDVLYDNISLRQAESEIVDKEEYGPVFERALTDDIDERALFFGQTICNISKFFKKYDISYFSANSITSLSYTLWKTKMLPEKYRLHFEKLYLDTEYKRLENFAFRSYRGGLIYFKQPCKATNVYGYDVNSLYPKMMRKSYPITGTANYITFPENTYLTKEFATQFKREKKLGIFYCKIKYVEEVKAPFLQTRREQDLDCILLQVDLKERSNIPRFPILNEEWYDMYTSEELFYAITLNCYTVTLISGYAFEKTSTRLFTKFTSTLFILKEKETDKFQKRIYKNILNLLTGRLGMRSEGTSYYATNTLKFTKRFYERRSFLHMATFINAYGRIFIHKEIFTQLNNQNIVFYSHTDSIFISKPLPLIKVVNYKTNYIKRLGKFKTILTPVNRVIFLTINNYISQKLDYNNKVKEQDIKGENYKSWNDFEIALSKIINRHFKD